jgi:hypothetical protein
VQTRVFGIGGLMTGLTVAAFLRGVGDTRTPLYAMIAANLVNVALNYCLIFGHFGFPRWASPARSGDRGRGVGLRRVDVDGGPAPAVRREFHTELVAPDWWRCAVSFAPARADRRPVGARHAGLRVVSTIVARMGSSEMAASQALLSLMHLSFMQVGGVQMAVATMVGRYVGADLRAARRSRQRHARRHRSVRRRRPTVHRRAR